MYLHRSTMVDVGLTRRAKLIPLARDTTNSWDCPFSLKPPSKISCLGSLDELVASRSAWAYYAKATRAQGSPQPSTPWP